MRSTTIESEDVWRVRKQLGITQTAMAKRLGVSRRTIIRGEQRGLEIPHGNERGGLRDRWNQLVRAADAVGEGRGLSVTSRG